MLTLLCHWISIYINIAIDVKKEKEKNTKCQIFTSVQRRTKTFIGNLVCKQPPSVHLNKRERTLFRWRELSFTIFANKCIFNSAFCLPLTRAGCDKIPHILQLRSQRCHMCVLCVCVCAIPFAVPFVLFVFAMAMRFIRFDFSLHFRVGMEMAVSVRARCEETDEIVCRRLVEIDIREVSMFRQLYVDVDGTFRLKIQIVSISFVRQPYYRFRFKSWFLFPFVLRRVPIEFPRRQWHGCECNLTILSKQYYRLDVDQSNGTSYMRRAQRNTLIHCWLAGWLAGYVLVVFVDDDSRARKKVCQTHVWTDDRFDQVEHVAQQTAKW